MADRTLKVDREIPLGDDGWELWSYNSTPATGFLVRDGKQAKPRLEILYWRADRTEAEDQRQLVIDAETGNIGIGTASPSDKLTISGGALSFQKSGESVSEMGLDYDDASQSLRIRARTGTKKVLSDDVVTIRKDGTVKAAAFEGSGAGITGIKASNITSDTLAVDRVPSLDKLNGELPVKKISGELPIERTTGELPVGRLTGKLPIEQTTGQLPIERTSGQIPAERISGQMSRWSASGTTIYYKDNVVIGAEPGQVSGEVNVIPTMSQAASNAVDVKTAAQAVGETRSNNKAIYQQMAASIAAAADAATAATPAQTATPPQLAQAIFEQRKQLKIVDDTGTELRRMMLDEANALYSAYPVREGIPDAKGNAWRAIAASLSQAAGSLGPALERVRQSRQELERLFPVVFVRSGKLAVVGDSCLVGNLDCMGNIRGAHSDLAENYLSDLDLAPADVVCLDQTRDRITLAAKANDTLVIGVISSKPGFLLNGMQGENKASGTLAYPVALCGRVPCKVTDENGPICRGDLLTSSSTPGHAMKASIDLHRPGTIIGKALEGLHSGKGVIEIFVNLR
jgi:hypothetical protein